MSLSITYLVVPFTDEQTGKLRPQAPVHMRTQHGAIAAAEKLIGHRAGVVVLEQQEDAELGLLAEPRLVARYGSVPRELVTLLAA